MKKKVNDEKIESTQENIPVEDVKETPEKKEENKQPISSDTVVEVTPLEKGEDIFPLIEEKRKGLLADYKKSRKVSNIMMAVCVALIMGSIIMISLKQYGAGLMIAGYVLAGVTLVGLIVFYIVNKNKFPETTRQFIAYFFELTNRYIYGRKGFEGMHYTPKEKFDLNTILVDRVYKDVLQITSRNIVKGKYLGKDIVIGELALYNAGQKRGSRNICFLGKYISYPNNLHFEGRYIISITADPEKKVDNPTDIEDLTAKADGKFTCYCPDDKEAANVLGAKFMNAVRKVNVTAPMFNFNVVVWAGHTAAYISYDDPVMNVPFEKPYTDEPLKRYVEDLDTVLAALNEIAGK